MTTYYARLPPQGNVSKTHYVSRESATGVEYEIDVEVSAHLSKYMPARTWGNPDNWHPAEGGDIEDVTAYFKRHGCWVELDLTDAEIETLSEVLAEHYADSNEPDYDDGPDYDDRDSYCDY